MSQTPLTIQENQAALQIYEMVIFDVVLQQVHCTNERNDHFIFIKKKMIKLMLKTLCSKNSNKT